jgi:hypothetical protein
MSRADKHRFLIKILTLSILVACLVIFSKNANYARFAALHKAQEQSFNVSVPQQQNVPLRIYSIVAKSANQQQPELIYMVENVSDKPISAYAIRHSVIFGGANSEGVMVRNSNSTSAVLQPGQSEQGSLEGESYSEAVRDINLLVDFVEFTDGTTWGPDKFQTAERLAGQRAGAQAVTEHLLKLEQTQGSAALIDAVNMEDTRITPPLDHSPAWNEGFHEGINFKRGRLQRANKQGGATGIINELSQPFDVHSEGRKK